eukprot:6203150-Pleurochrysis_carterae.AAC.2
MMKRHHGFDERRARVADRGRVRGTQHRCGRGAPCLRRDGARAKVVSEVGHVVGRANSFHVRHRRCESRFERVFFRGEGAGGGVGRGGQGSGEGRAAGSRFMAAGKSVCRSGFGARGKAGGECDGSGLSRSGATAARASAMESRCRGEGRSGGGGGGNRYRAAASAAAAKADMDGARADEHGVESAALEAGV